MFATAKILSKLSLVLITLFLLGVSSASAYSYNHNPSTFGGFSKSGELRLYYSGPAGVSIRLSNSSGSQTLHTANGRQIFDTQLDVDNGSQVTVSINDGDGQAVGWISMTNNKKCGSGLPNGNGGNYAIIDVSADYSWAVSESEGQPLVSKQCWGDWPEWSGDLDFNDFFLIFSYSPTEPTPTPTPSVSPSPTVSPYLVLNKTVRNVTDNTEFSERAQAEKNEVVEYKLELTNYNSQVKNVMIKDTLPGYLKLVSGSVTIDGAVTSDSLVYSGKNLGTLAANETKTVRFSVRVKDNLPSSTTELVNVAKAWAKGANTIEDRAFVNFSATPLNSSLTISKSVRDVSMSGTGFSESVQVKPGAELEFQLVITATGNAVAQDVRVQDLLPGGLTYVSGSSGITAGGVSLGKMQPGQTRTVKIRVRVNDSFYFSPGVTRLVNTAQAQGSNTGFYSDTAEIWVERSGEVLGATDVDTGAAEWFLAATYAFYSALPLAGFQVLRKAYWTKRRLLGVLSGSANIGELPI